MAKQNKDDPLVAQRRWYAEELRWIANIQSERLVNAFATVPREAFLGRGPWNILGRWLLGGYHQTPNANPTHLNHDVLVAIDARRSLNNGQPSLLALLIDNLNLKPGKTVYHVGCGTGYYSAVMAEVVGPKGHVIAVEVDKDLARRSQRNLRSYHQAEVVCADGFRYDPGRVDAILVNAGATHVSPVWLDALRAKGRLIVPLTAERQGGHIFRAVRSGRIWKAQVIFPNVSIFGCMGGRDQKADKRLQRALKTGGANDVSSLRRDRHRRNPKTCWLHSDDFCLSRKLPRRK